ncbi:hypothetical protein B0H19DRAFT_1269902 [Mycena capillaripes]|nr:hypothetical protein B0H19DRAFT_1269902 [Mycena capillaripes]
MKKLRKGFKREMKNAVGAVRLKPTWLLLVIMKKFEFDRALANKKQRDISDIPEHDWTVDDAPHMAVSADGVPLIIHVPGAIKDVSAAILLTQLIDFVDDLGGDLPKCAGADKEGRGTVSSYKIVPGEKAGVFKMVKAWHAIGHENDDPTVARDMLKTGRAFSASLKLMNQLHLVSHRVNWMLKYGDRTHYKEARKLRKKAEAEHQFFKVIGTDDPLKMEGREIMYNRQTPLHPDKSDHKKGWAVLVVVGPFTGGALRIPCLNLRMKYTNGTMIMFRGKILPHEVEAFSGGQRSLLEMDYIYANTFAQRPPLRAPGEQVVPRLPLPTARTPPASPQERRALHARTADPGTAQTLAALL